LLAGATAAAMLGRKRGKRRADAAPPDNLKTDPLDPGASADCPIGSPGEPRP
jgi:hypothetical protein